MERTLRRLLGTALAIASTALAQKPVHERPPHAWDVAVWDRLLASTPANVQMLRTGDMILARSYVQAVRNYLQSQSGGVQPELAFDGGVAT
jgi:hypothetical protein